MNARPEPMPKDAPAPAGFRWDDPFRLDEQLSEEEVKHDDGDEGEMIVYSCAIL